VKDFKPIMKSTCRWFDESICRTDESTRLSAVSSRIRIDARTGRGTAASNDIRTPLAADAQ